MSFPLKATRLEDIANGNPHDAGGDEDVAVPHGVYHEGTAPKPKRKF